MSFAKRKDRADYAAAAATGVAGTARETVRSPVSVTSRAEKASKERLCFSSHV